MSLSAELLNSLVLVTRINTDVMHISVCFCSDLSILLTGVLSPDPSIFIMHANICNSYFHAQTIYFHITESIT